MEEKAAELSDHADLMGARSRKGDRKQSREAMKLAEDAGRLGEEYVAVWRSLLNERA